MVACSLPTVFAEILPECDGQKQAMTEKMSDTLRHPSDSVSQGRCTVIDSDSRVIENFSHSLQDTAAREKTEETGNLQNSFIHEPEEPCALFDSTPDLLVSKMDGEMTIETEELGESEELCMSSSKAATLRPCTNKNEDNMIQQKVSYQDSMWNRQRDDEEKASLDLTEKKYRTGADVFNDVLLYSKERDTSLVFKNVVSGTEKVNIPAISPKSSSSDDNSTEYWSEEDYRYPPQMSLSPLPGQSILRKKIDLKELTRREDKEPKKKTDAFDLRNSSGRLDPPRAHLKKREGMKTLTPIKTKMEHHHNDSISSIKGKTSPTITPLLVTTSPSEARSTYEYQWKLPSSNESYVSSPSLIRPTLSTTSMIQKGKLSTCSDPLSVVFSPRVKNDKLFESQRKAMPKRQVSRSQSSTTATTSKLFPEIPTISKTQGNSKSISDFRQSSSIFGKLVNKNLKGTRENQNEALETAKQGNEISKLPSSSRKKVGESTRRKIRRILSLH